VNYDVFSRYLDWMLAKGLVEFQPLDNREGVALTSKGEEAYRKLVQWINEIIRGARR
jgi:predicted transcriptional regulator